MTTPITLALFSSLAQGAPSVNVALKASFSSAPYLVELLYDTFLLSVVRRS